MQQAMLLHILAYLLYSQHVTAQIGGLPVVAVQITFTPEQSSALRADGRSILRSMTAAPAYESVSSVLRTAKLNSKLETIDLSDPSAVANFLPTEVVSYVSSINSVAWGIFDKDLGTASARSIWSVYASLNAWGNIGLLTVATPTLSFQSDTETEPTGGAESTGVSQTATESVALNAPSTTVSPGAAPTVGPGLKVAGALVGAVVGGLALL